MLSFLSLHDMSFLKTSLYFQVEMISFLHLENYLYKLICMGINSKWRLGLCIVGFFLPYIWSRILSYLLLGSFFRLFTWYFLFFFLPKLTCDLSQFPSIFPNCVKPGIQVWFFLCSFHHFLLLFHHLPHSYPPVGWWCTV